MSKHSNIIAFAGRKRSGKGMMAKCIREHFKNVVIVTVADNLKFLCSELLNTTYEKLIKMKDDGTRFEEKVDGNWISIINRETGIPEDVIFNEIGGKTFLTVREVLQVIGTDLIRKYVPDWHIDKTVERIKEIGEDKIVVVDDVRFPNEKCKIEELGGEVFFMIRPNCFDVSNHPSEIALTYKDFCYDKIIINDLPCDEMVKNFIDYYFTDECLESPILLSCNPWYVEDVMDTTTDETNFNVDRKCIARYVLEKNLNKPQFKNNGIFTFACKDLHTLTLFKRIILNERDNHVTTKTFAHYNPLTNEILKMYM